MLMNYLVVVAHPDDEVLGAGGTIYKLTSEGHSVDVCILSGEVTVRRHRPNLEELNHNLDRALEILGVNNVYKGSFPNIQFNNVPHIELVQFIEKVIENSKAEVIFTHHPNDLNNDHLHTSIACQAAVRLFQRREDIKPLIELLYMEILSSTDWALNSSNNSFSPNVFVEIEEIGINMKIEALSQYKDVMRDYPHPRSADTLKALATIRGSQSGTQYAESFESAFRRIV